MALEATLPKKGQPTALLTGPPVPTPTKRKPAKKTKKAVVFFEVEILDAKTKDKLCFLDKVRPAFTQTLRCLLLDLQYRTSTVKGIAWCMIYCHLWLLLLFLAVQNTFVYFYT